MEDIGDQTENGKTSPIMDYKFPEYDGITLPMIKPLVKNAKERIEAIRNMETRPDDILLAAYPRSGTHWVWEILNMLIQGKAEYTKDIKETAFLEFVDDFNTIDNIASPRILNSHVPYRCLPTTFTKNGGKIVHVIRNPKDQLVSWYKFLASLNENLKTMTWEDFFNNTLRGEKKLSMYGGWFAYEKEFEKNKDESIHVLHYEDLKMDPLEETRRLAKFLNVEVTEELLQDIIHKCHFTNMKEADKTIKSHKDMRKPVSHYRKGEIGDWKNVFTVQQNEIFDEIYTREMSNSTIKVTFCFN